LHQRERWTRHDAHLWIRHDAARFFPPGADPAEAFPHLKRQREVAADKAFARVAASQRVLAMLRAEVDEMKAELKRRRLEESKVQPEPAACAGRQSARRAMEQQKRGRIRLRQLRERGR
jgi:hypothetical protein